MIKFLYNEHKYIKNRSFLLFSALKNHCLTLFIYFFLIYFFTEQKLFCEKITHMNKQQNYLLDTKI